MEKVKGRKKGKWKCNLCDFSCDMFSEVVNHGFDKHLGT